MLLKYETPPDRAAINRENSLKSTGPTSEAGKKKSSLNAVSHGLTAQAVVLPHEDQDEYQRFLQSFHDDLKPVGVLEMQLVQSLAEDGWRLKRAKVIETRLFTMSDAGASATTLNEQMRALGTLSMHQNRIASTMERTSRQLHEIQAGRREKERQELRLAGRLYQLNALETEPAVPYDPAADGFVFSVSEIEAHVHRCQLHDKAFCNRLFGYRQSI